MKSLYRLRDAVGTEGVYIIVDEYPVTRETDCFYIIDWKGKERRIGKTSRNPFAHDTKQKALDHYWIRKTFHFRHVSEMYERLLVLEKCRNIDINQFEKKYGHLVHVTPAEAHSRKHFVFD